LTGKLNDGGCFIDVKSQFDMAAIAALGFSVWRL
jgi:UDP-N-acetyl-D-galactosamine dehydrogenase